jgi:hypothetical protein
MATAKQHEGLVRTADGGLAATSIAFFRPRLPLYQPSVGDHTTAHKNAAVFASLLASTRALLPPCKSGTRQFFRSPARAFDSPPRASSNSNPTFSSLWNFGAVMAGWGKKEVFRWKEVLGAHFRRTRTLAHIVRRCSCAYGAHTPIGVCAMCATLCAWACAGGMCVGSPWSGGPVSSLS